MSIRILKNRMIFDGRSEALIESGSIVIENDKIREVAPRKVSVNGAAVIPTSTFR